MAIFDEPSPLIGARPPARTWPAFDTVYPLSRQILAPAGDFFDVIAQRRSAVGGTVSERDLASLLWHSLLLRERNTGSRFGDWESRAAPSAGGLHSIGIACFPVDGAPECGFYDPEEHALRCSTAYEAALSINRSEMDILLGAQRGTTLQFIGDRWRYEACYRNWETLFWRDAGVILGVVALTATALGLTAIPVGRNGTAIITTAGFSSRYLAGGAIHIGSAND